MPELWDIYKENGQRQWDEYKAANPESDLSAWEAESTTVASPAQEDSNTEANNTETPATSIAPQLDEKIWKHGPAGEASHKITDSSATLQGGKRNCFHSDAKLGNFVKGPVSFTAYPDQMRFAALWTLNPQLLSCIPSTITTPVSVLNFNLPLSGAEELIAEAVAMMTTLVAVL